MKTARASITMLPARSVAQLLTWYIAAVRTQLLPLPQQSGLLHVADAVTGGLVAVR